MAYQVTTVYPSTENISGTDKIVTTRKKEMSQNLDKADVIDLYNECEREGYQVTPKYKTPDDQDGKTPFEIAEDLTKQGIDYKASLKLKSSLPYEDAKTLARIIMSHGFDFQVGATFKIKEDSAIDFDHVETWTQEDGKNALYKVNPKASSKDANELKGLYDDLAGKNYEPEVNIKPKAKSTDDEETDFSNQLAVYPDGTEITFNLKESE